MKLNNKLIYEYADSITRASLNDIMMPVKIGFFLKKNILIILIEHS